ncbi:MAG TPA: AAA family ATPase [Candidatus Saccharimonadales bacterium]|nr:AAA family ATPase [Candidatus Saccharimonadales bacterium]
MPKNIIGIGGTNGSGKDSLSEFLRDDLGWLFVSASGDLIIPELKARGESLERPQMAALTTQWRKQLGMGAVVDKAYEQFQAQGGLGKYKGLVISSLRHPGEADRLHELGGQVVWVDADPRVRYDRIYNRGQGDKDKKTFEQFLAEEQAEASHTGHNATLNTSAVKDRADIFVYNDSNDLEVFKSVAKKALHL